MIGVTRDEPPLLQLFLAAALRVLQLSPPLSFLFLLLLHASSTHFCWARLIETPTGCFPSNKLTIRKHDDLQISKSYLGSVEDDMVSHEGQSINQINQSNLIYWERIGPVPHPDAAGLAVAAACQNTFTLIFLLSLHPTRYTCKGLFYFTLLRKILLCSPSLEPGHLHQWGRYSVLLLRGQTCQRVRLTLFSVCAMFIARGPPKCLGLYVVLDG